MPEISKIIETPISSVEKIGTAQRATIAGIFPLARQYTMPSSTKVVTYVDSRLKVDGSTSSFNVSQATQLIFDLSDSSNSGHPFTLATANNESTNYANVTSSGTPGQAGATLTTTLPLYATHPTLWWYCSSHSSEGASFAILEPPPPPGPTYVPEFMYNPISQDIEIDGTEYTIGGGLDTDPSPNSQNIGWGGYSMGSQFTVNTDGLILGVGVHCRYDGSYFKFYELNNGTALFSVDNVSLGNGQSSGNWNYNYHILSTPLSVTATTVYIIMHRNTSGGYAYGSEGYGTSTDSGDMSWRGGRFASGGSYARYPVNGPYTTSYGAPDVIFTPDD